MPVSFTPSKVDSLSIGSCAIETPSSLLSNTTNLVNQKPSNEIFQSSFLETSSDILPSNNGFVQTILDAYNQHRALIIRPDDIWLAILVQFSFFVNGNPELLRSQFVSHEGKKELLIKAVGTRYTVDLGHMSRTMVDEIEKNIVDPSLRAWIMPEFSTTTLNDTIVCSVVMMATLKEYFSYRVSLMCGIPRVTLEGEKKDWENILQRLEKLKEYGVQTIAWYHLLVPVLSRFVKAFDDPNGKENLDFWQRVAHYEGGGSGPTWLAGWITAFCVFDAKGKWIGDRLKESGLESPASEKPVGWRSLLNQRRWIKGRSSEKSKAAEVDPTALSSAEFFKTYMISKQTFRVTKKSLILDAMTYHRLDTNDIPPGYAEVDVKLDDNGEEIDCMLTAGLVGIKVRDSKDLGWDLRGSGIRDVVSPVSGWWMSTKRSPEDQKGNRVALPGPVNVPVSFTPSKVEARSIESLPIATPSSLLSGSNYNQKGNEIFQSSFPETSSDILPSNNGFVQTILGAYNQHRALIIRPDDVWLAILVQFSFFVNGNAELLRSQFVSHEGKKELVVKTVGTRYTVDFGHMSRTMVDEIEKNIVDPSLRAWIMPEFSTTTLNDTTVCSMVMMATLKEYFSYMFGIMCGIPRVTLEGEKKDWENILQRLEKLKEYGVQAIAWYHLLVPVLSRFVKAFDDPNGKENLDFWQRVAHYEGGGSGPTWLSGWITAFCVFDAKGKWIGDNFRETAGVVDPTSLSSAEFFKTYMIPKELFGVTKKSIIDDMPYHHLDTDDIPPGYAEVDVKLDDNGEEIDCLLTAGLVGSKVRDSKDFGWKRRGSGIRDVVSPVAGWWMSKKPSPEDQGVNEGSLRA